MTRRLLESAKGLIVHSEFMVGEMRTAGFAGPIARIPHGAWIPQVDRFAYRDRLGVDEDTPLIGIFGHLKPYKRIAESLRAFRRLVRVEPRAKMILVGEKHPDFQVDSLIRTLDLWGACARAGLHAHRGFRGLHRGLRYRAQPALSRRSARPPAVCCARWDWDGRCWCPKSAHLRNCRMTSA